MFCRRWRPLGDGKRRAHDITRRATPRRSGCRKGGGGTRVESKVCRPTSHRRARVTRTKWPQGHADAFCNEVPVAPSSARGVLRLLYDTFHIAFARTSCRKLQPPKVVPRGLEPRTLRLLAVRSNQLSYETSAAERLSISAIPLFVDGLTFPWPALSSPRFLLSHRFRRALAALSHLRCPAMFSTVPLLDHLAPPADCFSNSPPSSVGRAQGP